MAPFAKVVQVCIYNEFIHKITIVKSGGKEEERREKEEEKERREKEINCR